MIEKTIQGKKCFIFDCGSAETLLIQPIGDHDLEFMDSEVDIIVDLCKGWPFTLVMFLVDWNQDLAPWEAAPVMGDEPFGNGAGDTLNFIKEHLIPEVGEEIAADSEIEADGEYASKILLGGYSLAGLFALWAAYQTDLFAGAAAASPSVWYPDFPAFAEEHPIKVPKVYLSLGTKEEKTRHPVMKTVGDNIRRLHQQLDADPGCETTLEMNPGNHFKDPDLRMAKGFAWLLGQME